LLSATEERGGTVIGGNGGRMEGGEIDTGLVESPCEDCECSELVSLISFPSETENFLFILAVGKKENKNELCGISAVRAFNYHLNTLRYPTKQNRYSPISARLNRVAKIVCSI
jgi:hypothetical protein